MGIGGLCCLGATSSPAPRPPDPTLRANLERHVRVLAQEIGERHTGRPEALARAAAYVENALAGFGYRLAAQEYRAAGVAVRNVEAEVRGAGRAEEVVLVGAHYDSAWGTPGADDNGTGVAALLEIARAFARARRTPACTVRFVGFVNEEPPFFQTPLMGSRVYARRCRERGERVVAMLCLETIGYYSDAPGSQRYPFPLQLLYPDTGNFLGFVGNLSSGRIAREAARRFRDASGFPAELAIVPAWFPGVDLSDHWSFWQEGYPAVLVTDTAPFRSPFYHTAGDMPDRVDFDRLARVTVGLAGAVVGLAGH
ncbi:MAG: M20/M25/M40 family metallo-hydrolase [Deltaproteobacteria bacterium]|nr:M20/M25/M40 family metallo-hydrolase [Deltaproteobacteria bacterium]